MNQGQCLILCTSVIVLSGCISAALFYTGDGKFTDNGFLVYSRRYEIDLGPIDLAVPGVYSYKLSGLPHAELVVGIRVFEERKNEWDVRPEYPAVVRIQMQSEEGETVILEEGSLNSWVRSYGVRDNISELYLQGKGREIPLPGGGTKGQRIGFKASGGWGTHFDSETNKAYYLRVEVVSGSLTRPARVHVDGFDR